MLTGVRVLITNCWLQTPAGTEQYVRDLSAALLRRGHEPVVFSPLLGQMAEQIQSLGVAVADDLSSIAEPDILHCHNHHETIAALTRFPDRPELFVQHGATAWQDKTPLHPRLRRYVVVDELCRQRTLAAGVPAESISLIANGVDLDRFQPRDPLPASPRRAVVLSNYASDSNYVPTVQAACERMGIELDVVGAAAGTSITNPETVLSTYDLVFAKARAAAEGIAVGCAVVVTDASGLAGMATSDVLRTWRTWNLGRALQTRVNDVDSLCAEIDRYSPDDAAACRDIARAEWSLEAMTDLLIAEYEQIVDDWDPASADHRAELIALAAPLSRLGPLEAELEHARPHVEGFKDTVAAWRHEQEQARAMRAQNEALKARVAELEQ